MDQDGKGVFRVEKPFGSPNLDYFEADYALEKHLADMDAAGADHIVYGSSYPVKLVWMTGGPTFVQELDIAPEEKELILNGNAQNLYKL